MKIEFLKDVELRVVDYYDCKGFDVRKFREVKHINKLGVITLFQEGDVLDVDMFAEDENSVALQIGCLDFIFGIPRDIFEVVHK